MMIDRPLIHLTEEDCVKRIAKCQQLMAEKGLNGCVFTASSNQAYYCDFRVVWQWNSLTRPVFLFIPVQGKPVFYTQIFMRTDAEIMTKGVDVIGFNEIFIPPVSQIKEIMHSLGMDKGKIGWELGLECRLGCTIQLYESIKGALNEAEFVDCSDIVWKQRLIKDAKEIQMIKAVCEATDYCFEHLAEQLHPGMSEIEVWRRVQILELQGGAECTPSHAMNSGPANYTRGSKTADNDILEKGNMLSLDLTAYYCGYYSDFCRNFVLGKISQERQDTWQRIVDVTAETSEALKPGVSCSEVARICARAMAKRGYESNFEVGRLGHGCGLNSTEPPSIMIGDETVLEPGMIIHIEPGVVNEHGLFVCEEKYVITETGRECLSGASRILHEVDC